MFQPGKFQKLIAVFCVFALVFTVVPVSVHAAAKPEFTKKYTALYENDSNKGVYLYTIQNLTKGQKVKWSVSGSGKSYVKLNKTSTKVSKTSVTNKLTVITKGQTAAKNKTVKLTAKVYSKAGKLLNTLSAPAAKIKVCPTKIQIVNNAAASGRLLIGKSYQFQYKITPANATSRNEWIAMDEAGNVLPCMTKTGKFTPGEEGNYTIAIQAKIDNKIIKAASRTVTVSNTMLSVKQTAADKIEAVYSSSARGLVKQGDFTIKNSIGASIVIKSMAFSKDGTAVTLTTQSLLKDGSRYSVTDGAMTYHFTAHIGKPERLEILTKEITVNKETAIDYALYDENGIDVKAACKNRAEINENDYKITNGYLTKDKKVFMQKTGDTGTISMTYADKENGIFLTASGSFTCVAANTSNNTHFTLTTSDRTPDYTASGYKDNLQTAAGQSYYAHFSALDEDGSEIGYESIQMESSDPDTLFINMQGNGTAKVTTVKTGTVTILVTAVYAKQEYTYQYEVTVVEAFGLQELKFDRTQVEISNTWATGYQETIAVQGIDQYGNGYPLSGETAQFTDNSTYKNSNLVSYDTKSHKIIIRAAYVPAGVYSYTLTVTMGEKKASGNFSVEVRDVPVNGLVTYRVLLDQPVLDLAVTDGLTETELVSEKSVNIRLAEYRGGVFYNYVPIYAATVTKDGLYYGNDLTKGGFKNGTAAGVTAGGWVELKGINLDGNICTRAAMGTYTIRLEYYRTDSSSYLPAELTASLQVKDSRKISKTVVKRTTASVSCKTALELARDCLAVENANGEIVSCVVTGEENETGSYKLAAGESVNIKTVTVQTEITLSDGRKIIQKDEVSVGKTLKNA